MRSRYTAHVLGDIDYLLATWAPEIRHQIDPDSVRRWATDSVWQSLTVLASSSKGERGQVEFVARYIPAGGTPQVHHELSDFRREQGHWYFIDGVTPKAPGRNSLCPCGSGKKFKRCCA
jgi:SEC-C motif-containing protein